jgi:hypothetical protein
VRACLQTSQSDAIDAVGVPSQRETHHDFIQNAGVVREAEVENVATVGQIAL